MTRENLEAVRSGDSKDILKRELERSREQGFKLEGSVPDRAGSDRLWRDIEDSHYPQEPFNMSQPAISRDNSDRLIGEILSERP